jgi:hypothetical protein
MDSAQFSREFSPIDILGIQSSLMNSVKVCNHFFFTKVKKTSEEELNSTRAG